VQRDEALALLGLTDPFDAVQLRLAYRAAARLLHPDRPDAPPDATERMVAVNLAHGLLGGTHDTVPGPPPAPAPARQASHVDRLGVELGEDGTLLVDAPAEETFERLLEAVEAIGDPTYVDTDAGLLQIIVGHDDATFSYLTFSLQGRAAGTEVFTTVERLDGGRPDDPWPLLEQVAERLREC
jgi:hypothetical protein